MSYKVIILQLIHPNTKIRRGILILKIDSISLQFCSNKGIEICHFEF